jgi:hypothetical protein
MSHTQLRAVNDALWRDFWRSLRPRPIAVIIDEALGLEPDETDCDAK